MLLMGLGKTALSQNVMMLKNYSVSIENDGRIQ